MNKGSKDVAKVLILSIGAELVLEGLFLLCTESCESRNDYIPSFYFFRAVVICSILFIAYPGSAKEIFCAENIRKAPKMFASDVGTVVLILFGIGGIVNLLGIFIDMPAELTLGHYSRHMQLLIGIFIGPLFEEIVFRSFIFQTLKENYGFWIGAATSAFLWAIFHDTLWQFVFSLFAGVLYARYYDKYRSIYISLIPHMLWNAWCLG